MELSGHWNQNEITCLRSIVDKFKGQGVLEVTDDLLSQIKCSLPGKLDRDITVQISMLCANEEQKKGKCSRSKERQGKWLKSEEALLRSNAEEFLSLNGFESIDEVFDLPSKQRSTFFKHCAIGINRRYELIWRKCLRMLDPKNFVGQYTQFEEKQLLSLLKVYKNRSNKWKLIGDELGRSAQSVRDKCTKEKSKAELNNKRLWSPVEVARLHEGVKKFRRGSKCDWSRVASYIGTKTVHDCISKRHTLSRSLTDQIKFTISERIRLIELIDNQKEVKFIEEVNWDELAVRCPLGRYVSGHNLKRCFIYICQGYVPLASALDHKDVLKLLRENYVDKMKIKLKEKEERRHGKMKRKVLSEDKSSKLQKQEVPPVCDVGLSEEMFSENEKGIKVESKSSES